MQVSMAHQFKSFSIRTKSLLKRCLSGSLEQNTLIAIHCSKEICLSWKRYHLESLARDKHDIFRLSKKAFLINLTKMLQEHTLLVAKQQETKILKIDTVQ